MRKTLKWQLAGIQNRGYRNLRNAYDLHIMYPERLQSRLKPKFAAFRASFVEAYESTDPQDGWERDLIEGCWEEFEGAYEGYEEIAPGEYREIAGIDEDYEDWYKEDHYSLFAEENKKEKWTKFWEGAEKAVQKLRLADKEKMMKKFYEDEERVVVAQTLKNVEEGREDGRDEGREFQAFSGGAIKDTKGKLPYHLITKEMMDSVALGLECGLKKGYPARNWEKGLPLMEVHMAACLRHLYKFQAGYNWNEEQTKDGETFTTHHLDNAMSHLAMMVTQVKRGRKDLDDRADDYGLAITEEDI